MKIIINEMKIIINEMKIIINEMEITSFTISQNLYSKHSVELSVVLFVNFGQAAFVHATVQYRKVATHFFKLTNFLNDYFCRFLLKVLFSYPASPAIIDGRPIISI